MAIFPDIDYNDEFERLRPSDKNNWQLPSRVRAMLTILKKERIVDGNYLSDITDMEALENLIVQKICSYKDHSNEQLREIFCHIHIWGGASGRGIFVRGDKFNWDKISQSYKKLVGICLNTTIQSPNVMDFNHIEDIVEPIYDAMVEFHGSNGVHDIGASFLTKHTRFWLIKNSPKNPLPIYDKVFAQNIMDKNHGAVFNGIKPFWKCMIKKAHQENVSLLALERQLYNYFS